MLLLLLRGSMQQSHLNRLDSAGVATHPTDRLRRLLDLKTLGAIQQKQRAHSKNRSTYIHSNTQERCCGARAARRRHFSSRSSTTSYEVRVIILGAGAEGGEAFWLGWAGSQQPRRH